MTQRRDQLQTTLSGSYALECELGGGGMSRVFVAEELRLKRRVVVNVLSPELAQGISVDRFERVLEAQRHQHRRIWRPTLAGRAPNRACRWRFRQAVSRRRPSPRAGQDAP